MRFGYACLSVMVKDCSPAKTVTVKKLETMADPESQRVLLGMAARANLNNTRRLAWHNGAHGLGLYRITPQMVPLATHPITREWDWEAELAEEIVAAGQALREAGLRISSHPGQYTVLNSPNEAVVRASIADLQYHARLHHLLDHGTPGRIVVHVGGAQGGKAEAQARFERQADKLDPEVRSRLILENDDTVWGTGEVLALCKRVGLPMVLDIHHHMLNPGGADLEEVLPEILATWPSGEAPKIHVSSSRSEQEPRAHADYVDARQFREFLEMADRVGFGPFDVMVEAKQKDKAAIKLAADCGIPLSVDAVV